MVPWNYFFGLLFFLLCWLDQICKPIFSICILLLLLLLYSKTLFNLFRANNDQQKTTNRGVSTLTTRHWSRPWDTVSPVSALRPRGSRPKTIPGSRPWDLWVLALRLASFRHEFVKAMAPGRLSLEYQMTLGLKPSHAAMAIATTN